MSTDAPLIIAPETPSPHAIEVPVVKVLDGDGFLTRIRPSDLTGNSNHQSEVEIAVRFGFVDAPELDQLGGLEAKEFLSSLIGGRNVWIDILVKMNTGRSVDQYGRLVCVPYLRKTAGHCLGPHPRVARNIELDMVFNGWAWVIEKYGPDDRYLEALHDARANKRGIWARDDNIPPWTFKRQKFAVRRARKAETVTADTACPEQGCGGSLIKRNGRFGEFWGCSHYPKCKYSCSLPA